MSKINEYWSMNEGAFACLHDSKRTRAFRKAIRNSLKKNDVVVELGAGTGILSMFAVDAGASKVYAVELDQANIHTLEKVFQENGYSEKIKIIQGDATTVELPEKVDYVICEMIATGLIEELQVPAMNNILRFLKPDGQTLLSEYHILAELVFSKATFYNKKFNIIRYELPEMHDMRSESFSKKTELAKLKFNKTIKNTYLSKKLSIEILSTGTINAIRIQGLTIFADQTTFQNSTAYDFPIILPIESMDVQKGDILKLSISYTLCGGASALKYKVST